MDYFTLVVIRLWERWPTQTLINALFNPFLIFSYSTVLQLLLAPCGEAWQGSLLDQYHYMIVPSFIFPSNVMPRMRHSIASEPAAPSPNVALSQPSWPPDPLEMPR